MEASILSVAFVFSFRVNRGQRQLETILCVYAFLLDVCLVPVRARPTFSAAESNWFSFFRVSVDSRSRAISRMNKDLEGKRNRIPDERIRALNKALMLCFKHEPHGMNVKNQFILFCVIIWLTNKAIM